MGHKSSSPMKSQHFCDVYRRFPWNLNILWRLCPMKPRHFCHIYRWVQWNINIFVTFISNSHENLNIFVPIIADFRETATFLWHHLINFREVIFLWRDKIKFTFVTLMLLCLTIISNSVFQQKKKSREKKHTFKSAFVPERISLRYPTYPYKGSCSITFAYFFWNKNTISTTSCTRDTQMHTSLHTFTDSHPHSHRRTRASTSHSSTTISLHFIPFPQRLVRRIPAQMHALAPLLSCQHNDSSNT